MSATKKARSLDALFSVPRLSFSGSAGLLPTPPPQAQSVAVHAAGDARRDESLPLPPFCEDDDAPPDTAQPAGGPALRAFTRKRPGAPLSRPLPPPTLPPPPSPPLPRHAAPAPRSPRLRQLFIDAGQRDFGAAPCGGCGMVYARGVEEDEAAHAAFHEAAVHPPPFRGWAVERVVPVASPPGCHVLLVLPTDPHAHVAKAAQLAARVTAELGLPEGYLSFEGCGRESSGARGGDRTSGGAAPVGPLHCFVCVGADKRVCGALFATQLVCSARDGAPPPPRVGVRAVWVHALRRRAGAGGALVEAARAAIAPDAGRSAVAFSHPTPSGRALAAKYTGTHSFAVFL